MTVALKQSGGYYVEYLRASSNALTGAGSYVSVELQNPTFNASGGCTAGLAAYQSINGTVTQVLSSSVNCHDGMQVRTAVTSATGGLIFVNGYPYAFSFSSH